MHAMACKRANTSALNMLQLYDPVMPGHCMACSTTAIERANTFALNMLLHALSHAVNRHLRTCMPFRGECSHVIQEWIFASV